ncbi:hypothetical protein J3D52_000647 [Achromobacter insolitus]|nr:hypothetical protein [Achromobacter insolitus]
MDRSGVETIRVNHIRPGAACPYSPTQVTVSDCGARLVR